jgi:hypothetical protein
MDITNTFTADETRCDSCGTPTPRLTPPQDIELCDDCSKAEESDDETPYCIYCGVACFQSAPLPYCSTSCSVNAATDNQEDR